MWGFITVMNDVLINTFRDVFALSNFQSGLVQFSFFGAYFIVSLTYFLISSRGTDPINRIGYRNGMAIGLVVAGIGCLLFYPAGMAKNYGFFLAALFVLATGITILQIAANPYAAIMGDENSAASRLNFAQGFNSLGTTVGPIIGAILIYSLFSDGERSPESVGKTYLLYGILFFALAALIKIARMPSFKNEETVERGIAVLNFKNLRYGILAIFCYVGAEVAIGSWLVLFFADPNVLGLDELAGNKYLAYYWGGLMIGRLLGALSLSSTKSDTFKRLTMPIISILGFAFIYFATGVQETGGEFFIDTLPLADVALFLVFLALNYFGFILGKNSSARTLMIFASAIVALIFVSVFSTGYIAFWAIIATGLFNSIMWSNIFTLSIAGLGKYTSQGSSLLIMAIVGGAIITPLHGLAADYWGIRLSYLVPILPYAYLAWFGWKNRHVAVENYSQAKH
jgi:FHS family L-fucose permease-like MFS transporter